MQSMNPETAVTNTHGHFNQVVFAVYMWIHACGPSMEEPAVVSHSTAWTCCQISQPSFIQVDKKKKH